MGLPLFPIIADILMQDLEDLALNSISVNIPIYYRYTSDIVLTVLSDKVNNVLNIFNNLQNHNRI